MAFSAARSVRILHGTLTVSVVLITAVFIVLDRVFHLPPVLSDLPVVGRVLAVIGVLMVAGALAILRPKIPERRSDQTPDAFWEDVTTRGAALLVWALCEGGGIAGAVAFRLTCEPLTLGAAAIALIAMTWTRPGALERSV